MCVPRPSSEKLRCKGNQRELEGQTARSDVRERKGSRIHIFQVISWKKFVSLEDTSTAASGGQLECCSHSSLVPCGWNQPSHGPRMALQADIWGSLALINIYSLSSQEAPGSWERGEEFQ